MPVPPKRPNRGWDNSRKGKRRGTDCGRRRQTAAACLLELTHTTLVEQESQTAEAAAADVATAAAGAAAAAVAQQAVAQHAAAHQADVAAAAAADVRHATAAQAAADARQAAAQQATAQQAAAQQAEAEEDASPSYYETDAERNSKLDVMWRRAMDDRRANPTTATPDACTPENRELPAASDGTMVQVAPPPCPPAVQSASASAQTEMSFDQDTCAKQELLPDACMIVLPCEAGEPPAVGPTRQECVESMFGCPGRQGSLVGKYVRITGMVTEAYAETETVRVLWDDHETRSTLPVELVLDNQVVMGRRRCVGAQALGRAD